MFVSGALVSCASSPDLPTTALPEGFTCCNLHFERNEIVDVNWSGWAFIPAGARIKVLSFAPSTSWFGDEAEVEIDGKRFVIANKYGRKQESIAQYLAKIVVQADPKPAARAFPDRIRHAIEEGKVVRGMTREQVLISLGYPATHRTPDLKANVWHYWASRRAPYEVRFDERGVVHSIVLSY